jgi:hypothetical protein
MITIGDAPAGRLIRHFFGGLFDFGVLSDAGVDSFKRMLLGITAVFLALGLLLVRVFMAKYAELAALATPEPYRQALVADHAFLIAVPMWIVAFVTVLVSHALFPDDTDFRILMALPISRRLIFAAKLAAVGLFAGLFIVATHAALVPLFLLTSLRSWAEGAFAARSVAFVFSSLLASTFVVLAVAAIQGLLVVFAPRSRLLAVSAAMRSVLLCGLVLSLPFVLRLPAQALPFAQGSRWLYLAPPAWFLGVERWLLGDRRAHIADLAGLGILALALAAAAASASYALLYRHFDRVILRDAPGLPTRFTWRRRRRPRGVSRPAFSAVRAFTTITLGRSILHQGIVVALSSAAAGLVINSLIAADLFGRWRAGNLGDPQLVGAVTWAPFALIFAAALAVRVAIAVPIELRANWIFRLTEQEAERPHQMAAAARTVLWLGVAAPAALMLPVQWMVLERAVFAVVAVELVCGWLFVELILKDWERIPFTCSYLPGKGFVPQTLLAGFLSFVLFTTLASALARFSLTGRPLVFGFAAIVAGTAWLLARRRRARSRYTPIAFEDVLPNEICPLRLID